MAVDVSEMESLAEQVQLFEAAENALQRKQQSEVELFDILGKIYKYTDEEKVIKFLKEHNELWEILLAAPQHIRKHFGSPVKLTLHFFTDPEHPNEKKIVVYFATKLSIEERIAAWEKFGEEWWWNHIDEHLEHIHFHDIAWREN